ncbi:pyridoxal phosphate enzyme, YggS family [Cryptobacterium curtum DSM 15641]|uniref:Pyridoxal phosphate homeostasis protein n=1 Tax=Cryptobacterium curtum (strain ATCC 700683 / DSM 15641 / CCUG 43107 / 12-3) TaxID=469378 RepID=C7MP00_CRYCD|nr:YggS family pyridoxal phosphate-dependent enzyme [Cryptobacterium curtum]ACU94640.1 pyridoxal phosphate enzyme, YggS family [Cryptobacterium curtum DSM 15641]
MTIAERYRALADEVAREAIRAGRDSQAVKLIAVSKTVGPDAVAEAIHAGAQAFGENRPDQIMDKQPRFPEAEWHFIGNIQSRRIKDIVPHATLIHSVFEESHLARIDHAAAAIDKVQDILIEVNVSGEASKGGAAPDDVASLIDACRNLSHIRVRGLMTMAPQGDLQVAEETFVHLAALKNKLVASLDADMAAHLSELSMGMSEDWRCAIKQGATMVRIGRAIFSDQFAE